MAAHPDVEGVAAPALVQTRKAQAAANQAVHRIPVLEVEKVGPSAKDLSLVVALEPEPLPHVHMPDPRLERRQCDPLRGGDFR